MAASAAAQEGTDARPQFEGVHHVLLGVPPDQKQTAKRFYEEVLGFVPLASPLESGGSGNLWWYECGSSELHIALVADYRPNVRPHVAIRVKDLPAYRERLRRHGIETRLNFGYAGSWRIYIVDPWNNRLEFIEPLPPGVTPPPRAERTEAARS
ncbi:MAG TPA: VOC family protein [Chloroflexota bacterium]|jgi:catechol 2,3-dioxygenase-like lactoylglutathione lyase family enzyme|nr:VOC family protein [Chloroflexota bacterium]